MCVNRNILVVSLASLFVFCEVSYANRGEAVGQLMVKLGNALTQGGSKANALKAKAIRSKFLTEVKADHAEALGGLSRSYSRGEFLGLFPYSISKALGTVDDAIILKNRGGSVSATEAFIKVFHSKELLDVNSIHQMWFVVVKVFPNKTDGYGFLQDFVEVIFKKFAETPYDFEVYRAAASLVKGFSSIKNSEIVQSLSRISEDIMRLGHIVNGREITEGSLNVISPFRVVASGRGVGIAYSDEWIKNTSRMIDEAATTGSLSDLSSSLSSAFKRAREFGNQFVGDGNLAKKVIFDFKEVILKGGELKDEVVTTYFRWILNDRKILSISDGEVAKIIAEIIESKNLFHLMDDPEISRILDEVPDIMESITKLL